MLRHKSSDIPYGYGHGCFQSALCSFHTSPQYNLFTIYIHQPRKLFMISFGNPQVAPPPSPFLHQHLKVNLVKSVIGQCQITAPSQTLLLPDSLQLLYTVMGAKLNRARVHPSPFDQHSRNIVLIKYNHRNDVLLATQFLSTNNLERRKDIVSQYNYTYIAVSVQ